MEILQYTEEHRIFRDTLRKFLEKEVTPFVDEWEKAGIVPKSIWKKMGEQGYLCPTVPEEYGGVGADEPRERSFLASTCPHSREPATAWSKTSGAP